MYFILPNFSKTTVATRRANLFSWHIFFFFFFLGGEGANLYDRSAIYNKNIDTYDEGVYCIELCDTSQ